jgi:RHS repeat-associated protein
LWAGGDNFTVSDTRGRIIEEDHYYAFGLKIAGISSKKFGDPNEGMLDNENLYNDKELFDDADLDWYDYGFRNYDPQIGRFTQLDPLTDGYPYYTPYQFAGNEPIANVDLDGLEEFNAVQTLQEVVIKGIKRAPEELAKTSSHIVPIAIQGIHLAAAIVQQQISSKTLNKDASAELSKNVTDYYLAHKNDMSFTDFLALNSLANNYYKGLNCMAWWAKGDFIKLNNSVINSTLPDALKVARVQLGIEDSQQGWRSFFHSGADVVYFISSLALFPEVGMGPKGSMLKFRKPPQVTKQGTTVLGKFPDYMNLAEKLGARRFNIPTNIWDKMTLSEQWAANVKFLDRVIARGDKIVLSNRVTDINKVTGAFRKELDYLVGKGYRLGSDGLQMIK